MAKWTIDDYSTGSQVTLTFVINPLGFQPPGRSASFSTNASLAPNGQRVRFSGQDEPRELTFNGACLTEAFYKDLDTWSQKRYPLVLTDDLGDSWSVLIKEWTWTRLNRHGHPWRRDYTASLEVL